MIALNLAVRFLLELAAVAALALWGWHATDSSPLRVLAAVAAPLALIAVWAVVVAPGAHNPIPQDLRMLIGTALLLVAAGALALAGHQGLAVVFAVLVLANQVLLLLLRGNAG